MCNARLLRLTIYRCVYEILCMRGGVILMDHDAVVRQQMTEKYLLDELDPAARDVFEEHYFDCPSCAVDVQAGVVFIEQTKIALARESELTPAGSIEARAASIKPPWMAEIYAGVRAVLRPAIALPVMALLLAVVGYQNLVTYPPLRVASSRPQVLPWAAINVGTYGSGDVSIPITRGQGFALLARIPENGYARYIAELQNPAGKVEWSLPIAAIPGQDRFTIQIPGTNRGDGSYILVVHGVTADGISKEVGQASFELQIQNQAH